MALPELLHYVLVIPYCSMQENLIVYHQDAMKMTKYIQFHVT